MKSKDTEMSASESPVEYGSNEDWYANDLQLAAELGKGLLDRNQELEVNLKQQHLLIEEQTQEIQVLSRQSAALREVNESRLRVYEQLEAGIAELESTNHQLTTEINSDKKRIKSLCLSVDALETKCLELQQLVDELKANERLRKRRERHKTVPIRVSEHPEHAEEQSNSSESLQTGLQRRHSLQDHQQQDDPEWAVRLRAVVSTLKSQLTKEQLSSQDLRDQVLILEQENGKLLEQQRIFEEQQERLIFYHQAERLYWSCRHCRQSQGESNQADEESDDSLLSSPESFSLVEMDNGGQAYVEELSLTDGVVATTPADRNRISLLSELDAQYRAIIKKYEDLVLCSSSPPPEDKTGLFRSLSQEMSEASDHSSGISSGPEDEDGSIVEERGVQTEEATEGFEFHGPPPFKQLFEDIFAVLKRSAPACAHVPHLPHAPHIPQTVKEAEEEGEEAKEDTCQTPVSTTPVCTVSEVKRTRARKPRFHHRPFSSHYLMPVPSLIGFPLFKLPGVHSYAQVVKMSERAAAKAALNMH